MSKMSIDAAWPQCGAHDAPRRTASGPTMGTRYSAIYHASAGIRSEDVEHALEQAVGRVDQQMSTWKPQSDLNRLNLAPIEVWVELPAELLAVLEIALEIERASQGAFDVGVGDLVAAYGFGPHSHPTGAVPIASAGPRPRTSGRLELGKGGARKRAVLDLDLSGIAKGFAVDEMARALGRLGVTRYLVGIDGEMRAGGAKPDGQAWAVAHERPARDVREAMGVLELTDMAVATSGTYRHWRDHGGRSYSHTMCAKSGGPVINDLASVTVISPLCVEADAWATAFLVLGSEAGLGLATRRGIGAIFVTSDGDVRSTF